MKQIDVSETLVLPATSVIYWLDASTASTEADMSVITEKLSVSVTNNPDKLKVEHHLGQSVFWNENNFKTVKGVADKSELAKPSHLPYLIEGQTSSFGKYLPRLFSTSMNMAEIKTLVLYPSVLHSPITKSGGCRLHVMFDADETPAVWAIVTVTITVPGSGTQSYSGQCNQYGEVAIAFNQLPPLAEGVSNYSAEVSIKAIENPNKQQPIHPETLVTMKLRETDSSNFLNVIGITVVPGEVQKIHSQSKDYLAVQPVTD